MRALASILMGVAGLLAAGCSSGPSIGSAALARRPSPHLAPDAYAAIDETMRGSMVVSACAPAARRPGPASSLDASLIPSNEYLQEGRRAEALIEPYRFAVRLTRGPSAGWTLDVTVPPGFITDMHSKPGWSEQLTLNTRLALEAAVVHDWLYAVGPSGDEPARALADQAYADILAFYGVEGFTHWSVAGAVRLNGEKHFGAPDELRFYNKCFYGLCGPDAAQRPELRASPVVALPADPGLRRRLWDLTVCLEPPAPAPISAAAPAG
jgi:hypothetical protein